jgi:hypothetical protein
MLIYDTGSTPLRQETGHTTRIFIMALPGFGSPRIIFAMKSENVVQALSVSQFCCRTLSLIVVPLSNGFPSAQGFP